LEHCPCVRGCPAIADSLMEPGSPDDDAPVAEPPTVGEASLAEPQQVEEAAGTSAEFYRMDTDISNISQKGGETGASISAEVTAVEAEEQSANAAEDKPLPWWKKRKEEAAQQPRTRLGEGRCVGLVIEWRGHMGWIQPLTKINHDQAKRHRGRIYLAVNDIVVASGADEDEGEQEKKDDKEGENDAKEKTKTRLEPAPIKEGQVVDFFVYLDGEGLGAEECRKRTVLRLTLPHAEATRVLKDNPQWSEYLTDSEYYPAFEREHGVLLRKYAWPLPFAVLELWSHPEELVAAAIKLATPADAGDCDVRLLLPEDDLAKAEELPSAKVSGHIVVPRPLPCRSLLLQTNKDDCAQAIRTFLKLMASPSQGNSS